MNTTPPGPRRPRRSHRRLLWRKILCKVSALERSCRYVPLANQPLVLVLGQVRFSPVRQIADYIPAIQEEFRRHGFPLERAGKVQQLIFGPAGGVPVQVVEEQRWSTGPVTKPGASS